ncbi:MAG: YgiQ family radical SAM protein [Planctomycetes bacterium]|nr:YgiQ family radical SAM protein [Planctomycetota bacterium]MCB9903957.1 YgiQ family radical SAM protein [Planctomycetota bacterium]
MNTPPVLPISRAEIDALGWDEPDIVLVSGDAYVDHPSFAAGLLGRVLQREGYRVAILPQPDWKSVDAWRALGKPRLFYGVTAGNMDSMINHYTANKKRRNDDAYSPDGRIGLRPDRPTGIYAQRCREAFKGVPVIAGGIEGSLRRLPHYDYWADKVMPSMLVSSKADLLVYGLGDEPIVEIARRLDAGETPKDLRDMRGVCYLLGKTEPLPDVPCEELPSFEEVESDKVAFARMTRQHQLHTSPFNGLTLIQKHGDRTLVHNPPALPMPSTVLDRSYDLPYTRMPHPSYGAARIPAFEMIRDSVTIMRGCFGGCSFCSITSHEGKTVQSRSQDSVLREVETIAARDDFKGTISDLGGPTANMYEMRCTDPAVEAICRRPSCIHPKICKLLGTSHEPTKELLRKARAVPGVKRVQVASGIRMDLANLDGEFIEEVAAHHTGGHLKIAPEHASAKVLNLMRKPTTEGCDEFAKKFEDASKRAGKEQYVVPYFIASHPGSGVEEMIELAVYLKQRGYRPRQVQDFIPAPMDVAACMYWTGLDPLTGKPVDTVHRLQDRRMQRALLQFFLAENYFTVRQALLDHGRRDLIGDGPLALIPERPPKEAFAKRRQEATHVHAEDAGTAKTVGYRPGRRGRRRK